MFRTAALLLLLTPAAAAADDIFSLPQGCTAFMSVQMKNCSVSHHFTCDNDPTGWQRRVDLDESGITYAGAIDSETQWVESFHVLSNHSEKLEDSPADRASFTDLLANGVDSYDFNTLSPELGTTRYVGEDVLTGETVQIDGVTLERTEYNITAYAEDGSEIWRSDGREYILRDRRLFLSGLSTTTADGQSWESDDSPMEFAFPGDSGFLASKPLFGCGVVTSSWSPDE